MPNLLTRISSLVLLVCLFTSASTKAATVPSPGAAGSGTAHVVPAPDTPFHKLTGMSSTGQMLAVDSSGAMAVFDQTGPNPRKTSGNGLSLVGSFSFSTGASGTRMTVDHIINTRSSGTSGSLRLELWATTTVPVFGNTINRFVLGSFNLNPLQAGFEYNNVDTGFVTFTPPPTGCYYITVALLEFDSGTYFYEDLDTASAGGVANGSGFDLFSYGGANCSSSTGCVRDNSTACLLNGRFQVTVTYRTSSTSGNAQVMNFSAARAESDESAFFWFFDSSNFEMGLKMLDACSVNSRFWVYISGLTDQGWTATIVDTQTGVSSVYQNNVGHLSSTVADTGTLRCP